MRLISVNIEGDRHLDRVEQLFAVEQPDIVCVQEVLAKDIDRLSDRLAMKYHFAPMAYYDVAESERGVAIFAPDFVSVQSTHYAGRELAGPLENLENEYERHYANKRYQLVSATVTHQDVLYHFHTTHFPVTTRGTATWYQREAAENLLRELGKHSEVILCGDFNSPRGREIFTYLSEHFTDNIPQEYTTSIDGELHRAGPIPFMVDGLFTTPQYMAKEVRLVSGVSDHCAIVAEVVVV